MTPNIFLSPGPFIASSNPRRFRKELIRVGTWHAGDKKFSVDEALLLHWANTHKAQVAAGEKIALPAEHTADPDKNRGYVLDMEVAMNANGEPALFGDVEFAEGHEGLAKTTSVSIFSPPEFKDGKGNKYYRPIRHVALTNNPVVSGLGDFEPIAASFGDATVEFSLRTLASKLGVRIEDGADDRTVEETLAGAYKKLRKKGAPPKKDEDKEPVAASIVGVLRDNREMKLDKLVADGRVTKAVRDDLHKTFCSDEALQLSFAAPDAFETTIAALAKNERVLSFKEKTAGQPLVRLSHDENPVIRDAKARAAAAAGK
jgi:hypothetical protein